MELLMLSFQIMELDYVTPRTHKRKIQPVAQRAIRKPYSSAVICSLKWGRVMPHLAFEHFVPGKGVQKRRDLTRPRRLLAALFAAVTALYSQDLLADEG